MTNSTVTSDTPSILTEPSVLFIIIGTLLYGLYSYLVRPLNRIKKLGDLGFYFGENATNGDKHYEQMLIERMKKLRVLGELPPVYPNGWFCIAESRELDIKQVKPVVFMRQNLTLFRSESGKVHLLNAYCPHLGANFNVGGRVVDNNCIQCPFHGWVFSGVTGKCTRIPYSSSDKIPGKAEVDVWPVLERNKHVYVWYHCDGIDPTWEMPIVPEIESGEWKYRGRTDHEILCHLQEIPENGADIAHLNYLHLTGVNQGNDITRIQMDKTEPVVKHIWEGKWIAGENDTKHIGTMLLKQYMTFLGIQIPLTYTDLKAEQIGPGIVHMNLDFGFLGKGIVMQHITPEDVVQQRARFVMFAKTTAAFAKFYLVSEANHFERDIYIWTNKKYIKNPLYCKDDGPIGKHRRWFSQFYTDNSPRLNKDGTLTNCPKSINSNSIDW